MSTYDPCGNLIRSVKDEGASAVTTIRGYNGFGQQVLWNDGTTTVRFRYRPDGLRFSKQVLRGGGASQTSAVTTHYWDGQDIVLDVSERGATKACYLRGNGELISQEIGEQTSFYLHNAHGDVTERVDGFGNILKRYVYDSFGNIINPATVGDPNEPLYVDQSPFGYCGEYLDRETQEIYLRARYYDSASGRFLCEDPQRIQTKKLSGEIETIDALALNQYCYCDDDPVNNFDPDGESLKSWWNNTKKKISNAVSKVKTWVKENKKNIIKVAIGVAAVVVGAVIIAATAGAGTGFVAALGTALVAGLKAATIVGAVSAGTRVVKDAVVATVQKKEYKAKDVVQSAVDGFSSGFMSGGISFATGAIGTVVLPKSNGIKIGETSKADYGKVTIGYGQPSKGGFTAVNIADSSGKGLFRLEFDVKDLWHLHIRGIGNHLSNEFDAFMGFLIGVL